MKIIVTGAAGFIGSHLCERLLKEGHSVIGIDNFDPFYSRKIKEANLQNSLISNNFKFYELDISLLQEFKDLKNESFDMFIHLAAKAGVRPSIENPELYLKNNIQGTLNVLEFMKQSGCKKLVFASSSSVYGNNTKLPFEEDDITEHQISPYAVTKKSCELFNYNYHKLYSFDIVNLRFFTVYGPRQRPDLAIYKFVNKMLSNESIDVYGVGNSSRDYTYVDDIIEGIIGAVNYNISHNNVFEIVNLGNSKPISLIELIKKIEIILECNADLHYKEMQEGDVDITFSNISKAERLFGYKPMTTLDQGLRKFINWIKNAEPRI